MPAVAVLLVAGCVGAGVAPSDEPGGVSMGGMVLASPAFGDGGGIPAKYTCDGADVNPPLRISGVPSAAKSVALIVDDPDAPAGTWVHWVVWNIRPETSEIPENSVPGLEGKNDFRRTGWGGPCPPSGTHRYFFKLYALDTALTLGPSSAKADLVAAMRGHVLAQAQLVGTYRRT